VNIDKIMMIAKKICFRIFTCLIIILTVAGVGTAVWQAFILEHFWEGELSLLVTIGMIFLLACCQQIILWLLPKKERNFWQYKFI
jgi:hypothetical protein